MYQRPAFKRLFMGVFFVLFNILVCVNVVESVGDIKIRFGEVSLSTKIYDEIQQLYKKCLINLRGIECPNNNRRAVPENLIIAGLGYDRYSHDIKPQILKSNAFKMLTTPRVDSWYSSMNTAREFYSMIYPTNPFYVFYNGLYAHNGDADQMFTRFFSGNFNVANSQKQYITHSVNAPELGGITEDFSRILDLLPTTYDESIYNMIITYFGESVLTSVEYGGVVDSTVSIRSCFSDDNMANYVKSELSDIVGESSDSSVPLGYAQYHKVSQLDIAGGNPQEDDIPRRIASFSQNPVPIRFESYPIWMVFPEGPKKENMKNAYYNYVNSKDNMVNNMINRLNYLRDLETLSPTPFVAYTKKGVTHTEMTRGQVAGDNQVDVGIVNYSYWGKKLVQAEGRATVRIYRHRDDSFHIELDTRCSELNNFPGFDPVIIDSSVVQNSCVPIYVPKKSAKLVDGELVAGYDFDIDSIVICHGCNPELKLLGTTIDCPVPPAKTCPIVQKVQ